MGILKCNIGYHDARSAIRFLVDAFGFELVSAYEHENSDRIAHAELRWPGGGAVTVFNTDSPRNLSEAHAGKEYPIFSIHIDVEDPDAVYVRVVAAGAVVIEGLNNSPLGTRGFVVSDSEGLFWSFGTPLPKLIRNANGRWQPTE